MTAEDAYAYGKFARVALRHQRHRLPGPPALGRGGGLPRPPRRRHRPRRRRGDLRRPRARPHGRLLVGFEPEEESPDRRSCGCARRSASTRRRVAVGRRSGDPRPGPSCRRHADPVGARHRGRGPAAPIAAAAPPEVEDVAEAARRPTARSSWSASGWPACPARCPRRAALAASTGARLAWIPRRAGERGALEAGALPDAAARWPPGRRRPRPASTSPTAWGVDRTCPSTVGRDTGEILAAARRGTARRPRRRRRRPGRPARPAELPRRRSTRAVRRLARAAARARSPSWPTSCCRSRRAEEKARHVRRLGGPSAAVRRGARDATR